MVPVRQLQSDWGYNDGISACWCQLSSRENYHHERSFKKEDVLKCLYLICSDMGPISSMQQVDTMGEYKHRYHVPYRASGNTLIPIIRPQLESSID
ncbi:hypothetical protein OROGR_003919 [Orobanche gracilis]